MLGTVLFSTKLFPEVMLYEKENKQGSITLRIFDVVMSDSH